jgi:hypothetical protein
MVLLTWVQKSFVSAMAPQPSGLPTRTEPQGGRTKEKMQGKHANRFVSTSNHITHAQNGGGLSCCCQLGHLVSLTFSHERYVEYSTDSSNTQIWNELRDTVNIWEITKFSSCVVHHHVTLLITINNLISDLYHGLGPHFPMRHEKWPPGNINI